MKEKIIYLAGFIDGEGCFNISKCRNTYIPRILITNTNKHVLEYIKENFGGDIQESNVRGYDNWKTRYIWRLSNRKALELSILLMPYLIIKKNQAEIFKEWLDTMNNIDRNNRLLYYILFKERITILNKKGRNNLLFNQQQCY